MHPNVRKGHDNRKLGSHKSLQGLPKGALLREKRVLQQQTWQSQITGLPKGASRKTARELAQKAYQTKCGILDAMYPLQKYARDRMRIKKKLNEMSPDERIKYLCEHRAKRNERRYTQIHGTGSKSESTGPIFLEEDTQNHNTAETIDKTVKLLWSNTGQYETMLRQLLHDTVELEEQTIILQQKFRL